ncbi:MAG TPA: VOC family protein [Caulobacteraceae bacterium]|nr:VOC family protein [Caulobacteraceae bacterium]
MSAKPVLEQLNIVAGDIAATADFYGRLGVGFEAAARDPQAFHANGQAGEAIAVDLDTADFAAVWNPSWAGRHDLVGRIVVGFRVEERGDVDRLHADITAAGHKSLAEAFDAFWGARYAIVEDPNGVAVGLMSAVDPARRFWPPPGWTG